MSNIVKFSKYKEKQSLKLLSHNGNLLRQATVWLSTTKLPIAIDNNWYETCLFSDNDSESLSVHSTLSEAVSFHTDMSNKLGLKLS